MNRCAQRWAGDTIVDGMTVEILKRLNMLKTRVLPQLSHVANHAEIDRYFLETTVQVIEHENCCADVR